jgi:putative flippase GtrA
MKASIDSAPPARRRGRDGSGGPGRREFVVQLLKFLVVGVLNTALQYVVFILLYGIGGINYLVASAVGYCLGMVNSYFLNRQWTFASVNDQILVEAMRFVAVNLVALGTNTGLLFLLVSVQSMQPQVAQLWAIVGSVTVNFVLNRFWTFGRIALPDRYRSG